MKNYLVGILLICMFFSACEKDDICLLDTTPNLIVVFKDKDNAEIKKAVSNLTVWVQGKDSIIVQQSMDSIAIPIDLNNNSTKYFFANSTATDEFTLEYTRIDEFVSRSCGYKTLFTDIAIGNPTNEWISTYEISNTSVENENTTHITVYH